MKRKIDCIESLSRNAACGYINEGGGRIDTWTVRYREEDPGY